MIIIIKTKQKQNKTKNQSSPDNNINVQKDSRVRLLKRVRRTYILRRIFFFFFFTNQGQKWPQFSRRIGLGVKQQYYFVYAFKGALHLLPQNAPKLACFVLYLKIINIFLKNNICIL